MDSPSISKLLINKFIKNPDDTGNMTVRKQYGMLSGFVGMTLNTLLFTIKLITGIFTNSIAVLSDAFNNLSDCASCIVTLLGCRMAAKPADKLHPFGHGRMEYLTSLIISALIFVMGAELMKGSAQKIVHPENVNANAVAVAMLVVSICVKLFMFRFNSVLGKRIDSTVLIATAKDSRNDAITTSVALTSIIVSQFTSLPIDGLAGFAVSLFILKSGIGIIHDTVDELLGKPADPELVKSIREIVCSNERVLGVHDLMIHNYGPAKVIGSCHVELSCNEKFTDAHEIADGIERLISEKLGISMTIHMDPSQENSEDVSHLRTLLTEVIEKIDKSMTFHDLHLSSDSLHKHLVFDISAPYELHLSDDEICGKIKNAIAGFDESITVSITIDRE